jgi:hypothetical protein
MQALADFLSPWALPGVIVTSALGALLMCLLVLWYGLPGDEGPARRALVIRLGHAAAGVFFAVSALLGLVAMVERSRTVLPLDALPVPQGRLAGPDTRLRAIHPPRGR